MLQPIAFQCTAAWNSNRVPFIFVHIVLRVKQDVRTVKTAYIGECVYCVRSSLSSRFRNIHFFIFSFLATLVVTDIIRWRLVRRFIKIKLERPQKEAKRT